MLYLLVMAGCLLATLPLELLLGARVYRRPRRLLLTLAPVLAVFLVWDALAVQAGYWHYRRLTGVRLGDLPIEEIVFFLVIPVCALLTFEAVRRLRPAWSLGLEPVVDGQEADAGEPPAASENLTGSPAGSP